MGPLGHEHAQGNTMTRQKDQRVRAIVMGGSMAGLAVARALAPHFGEVTLIERDRLDDDGAGPSRKGVPQGNHGHALLAAGQRILETWFPGLVEELIAHGAVEGDATGDFLWFQFGAWKLREPSGLRGILTTRPALEVGVRGRVRGLANVSLLDGHTVDEPVYDPGSARVTGVRVTSAAGEVRVLNADLVVDATGRASATPRWLQAWGYAAPDETTVDIDVGYTSTFFERRPGDVRGSIGGVFMHTPPASTRGAGLFAVQGDRWLVTLYGSLGDHPPTELDGFRAYAKSLPAPDPYELVGRRAPLTPLVRYRFPANRRRHYERLARFPAGYLVFGDACCSFNPIYGQGMTVALLEGAALERMLAEGDVLARPFFTMVSKLVDAPWSIAVGEDLRNPAVKGVRPPGTALIHPYMARAHRVASHDPVVLRTFFEVAHLLAPPTAMLSPGIAWRVLRGSPTSVTA